MAKNYGYQYETSPRKIQPEYQRPKQQKKKPVQKKKQVQTAKKKAKNKPKKKFKLSFEFKFFVNSMLVFGIVFAIIACEALVKQRYKERESLRQEYNELLSSSRLAGELSDDVRTVASEYGMQTKSATLISLDTTDYIESGNVQIEKEEIGFWQKIINWFEGK